MKTSRLTGLCSYLPLADDDNFTITPMREIAAGLHGAPDTLRAARGRLPG